MPFEEISSIRTAEENAVKARAAAVAEASTSAERAASDGKAAIAQAVSKAEAERTEHIRGAEEKAAAFAEKLRADTADEKKALADTAEKRMAQAADIIVKKVVEG